MITFDKNTHIYTSNGIVYDSVSKVVSYYKKPFDKEYWSKKKAQERGVSQEVILNEWSQKSLVATTKGTSVHSSIEKYFLSDEIDPQIEKFIPNLKFFKESKFEVEKQVWSDKYKIAGTLDFKGEKDFLYINDWKTGKPIVKSSPFGKMQHLCSHLDDCNFNHYAIQLNIYAVLLGIPVEKLFITHFSDEVNIYEVPVWTDFTHQLLNDYVQRTTK
jgi:hypothetical protein